MSEVIRFRPSPEEAAILDQVTRAVGAKNRPEALRHLIRQAGQRTTRVSDDPVWRARVPKKFWLKRSLSNDELDRKLYGGQP